MGVNKLSEKKSFQLHFGGIYLNIPHNGQSYIPIASDFSLWHLILGNLIVAYHLKAPIFMFCTLLP